MNVYTEREGDHLCRVILFVQQSESNAWKTDWFDQFQGGGGGSAAEWNDEKSW